MTYRQKLLTYVLLGVGTQWVAEPLFTSLPPWAQALSRCAIAGLLMLKAFTSDPNAATANPPAPVQPIQKPADTTTPTP